MELKFFFKGLILVGAFHFTFGQGLINGHAPTQSLRFDITVDDLVYEVWMNGRLQPRGRFWDTWPYADTYTVPPGTTLIAIQARDLRRDRRYIAARLHGHSDGRSWDIRTGSSPNWYCNPSSVNRWNMLDFNGNLPRPVSMGGQSPIPGVGLIWSNPDRGVGSHAWCRFQFACTRIENCDSRHESIECTNGVDQQCVRCQFTHGNIHAYRLANGRRQCQKVCSWRPDSRYCYPGTCTGLVDSCRCAPGFSGNNCEILHTCPSITHCQGRVERRNGNTVVEFVEFPCGSSTPPTTYTNERATHIQAHFESRFHGPNTRDFPLPNYVHSYQTGITAAAIRVIVTRCGVKISEREINCQGGQSRDNPITSILRCNELIPISITLEHGDRLTITHYTENGGFVRINNFDNGPNNAPVGPPHYFSGRRTTTTSSSVVFDFKPPKHSGGNWLDIGPHYTRNAVVNMRWSGWVDLLSGLESYELELYEMSPRGNQELGYEFYQQDLKLNRNTHQATFRLNNPGMHCIVLVVRDEAGNLGYNRRFLLYDNISNISVRKRFDFTVTSAAGNTSYGWLTDLHEKVRVSWPGRFANEWQEKHFLLNAIRDHTNQAEVLHETTVGQPPLVRSREAIPNVHGVIGFDYQVRKDRAGGNTTTEPTGNWKSLRNFMDTSVAFNYDRDDGDSIRVFVRAHDVMNNTVVDSVLVHVDSSPPVIENFWITRYGIPQLAVHKSTDIFDMDIEFKAFDFDSGLHKLHWELRDTSHPDIIIDEDFMSTSGQKGCQPEVCYRTPMGANYTFNFAFRPKRATEPGGHDRDYYFLVTATNNAQLVSTFRYQITIDETPPEVGVVRDGYYGSPDVDFQSWRTLQAWWEGFFDKESGVVFYQYSFSDRCLEEEDFSIPEPEGITRTTDTFAGPVDVLRTGTYYVTVVAYNAALGMSRPVCSSGVTIDTTPPSLSSVSVQNLWTREGLALDEKQQVWYINNHRQRAKLINASEECRLEYDHKTDLASYPTFTLKQRELEHMECSLLKLADEAAYVDNENKIEFSWAGCDEESGVYDYRVGLGRSRGGGPDVLPYSSTHGHQHFLSYHPGLGEGDRFYIYITAINRAGLESELIIGPVLVVNRAPIFLAELTLELYQHEDERFLVSHWPMQAYDTSQVTNNVIEEYRAAIGSHPLGRDILPFTPLSSLASPVCPVTDPPTCVAVPVSELDWELHGRHTYYLTLELVSVTQLHSTVSSSPYTHLHGPPTPGTVVELPLDKNRIVHDVDQQVSRDAVMIHWYGFRHPDEEIKFYLGLGTQPGLDDTRSFLLAPDGTNKYLFTNLELDHTRKYYTTVRAEVTDGSVVVTSNGIFILPPPDTEMDINLRDGRPYGSFKERVDITQDHHSSPDGITDFDEDLQYQISQTEYRAFWNIPQFVRSYITSVMFGLQEQTESDASWEYIVPPADVGHVEQGVISGLHLEGGRRYRSSVQLCHSEGCFSPVYSDGVLVLTEPPTEPVILSVNYSRSGSKLDVTFLEAEDVFLGLTDNMVYEWTILIVDGPRREKQLVHWDRFIITDRLDKKSVGSVPFQDESMVFSSCVQFVLKATNPVGLASQGHRDLSGCDVTSRDNLVIFDAIGEYDQKSDTIKDIYLAENGLWEIPDQDYTPSSSVLSAVWPGLWHGEFSWSVVSDTQIRQWRLPNTESSIKYTDYNCDSPAVLACGTTEENFVNIHNLALVHGERYHVCLYANQTVVEFTKFSQSLPEVDVCNNGIISDHHPPEPGQVWVGTKDWRWKYQVDVHHLSVHWSGFADVENVDHHSGIHYYEISIGTSFDGVDVIERKNVGVMNSMIFSNLDLLEGRTYHVTMLAIDFVGRSTTVYSEGLTVDSTPPEVVSDIDVGEMYQSDVRSLSADWSQTFRDPVSGISYYNWCVGTERNRCNISPLQKTSATVSDKLVNLDNLQDGTHFYFTVQAVNGAGLRTQTSSRAVILDSSPPGDGVIIDIKQGFPDVDVDYQATLREYHLSWRGFKDPHSPVVSVVLSVGKCPGCEDVLQRSEQGRNSDLSLYHLVLEQGVVYYSSIEVCNAAGLCRTASTDGVIPDITPPHMGRILDGNSGIDTNFQSDRTTLSAHWINAHDVHSGISYFTIWAGTSSGGDDVIARRKLHHTNRVNLNPQDLLPINTNFYLTVEATDHAGLTSQQISDGFIVDTSPPEFISSTHLEESFGSIYTNTLIWRTSLTVSWSAVDPESSVTNHYISVLSRTSHLSDIPTVQIYGDQTTFTFTNVTLSDGESYRVQVTSCNRARLCTSSVTDNIMVDHSPPTPGAFAVDTDHAAGLLRHRDGLMTYTHRGSNTILHLAWVGFRDPHSDILQYFISVGTTFGGDDLSKPLTVPPQSDDKHLDEGYVHDQTVMLDNRLTDNAIIYIAIWAENKVGLFSDRLHGTFELIPSGPEDGTLYLVRRCEEVTCAGHCTCAPRYNFCSSERGCTNITGNPSYQALSVYSVIDYRRNSEIREAGFTRSQCSIGAKWKIVPSDNALPPKRIEWSAGVFDGEPGTGLLDRGNGQIWFEADLEDSAIFTTALNKHQDVMLKDGIDYQFHVRAWYGTDKFAVYRSPAIQTIQRPPAVYRYLRVREVTRRGSNADIDFIPSDTQLSITWEHVFTSDIAFYTVAVGSYYGGTDITSLNTTDTFVTLTFSPPLKQNKIYYSSVTAWNSAGLSTVSISDGFQVDLIVPEVGVVQDGIGVHDIDYMSVDDTSGAVTYGARWTGFSDRESGIHSYILCIGTTPGGQDIKQCTDVGLTTQISHDVKIFDNGMRLYTAVHAVDAVGHVCSDMITDGVTIDTTPPVPESYFVEGENLVQNYKNTLGVQNKSSQVNHPFENEPLVFTLNQNHTLLIIPTVQGGRYKLGFTAARHESLDPHYQQVTGYVNIPGTHQHFAVAENTRQVFHMTAHEEETTIIIGAEGRGNLLVIKDVRFVRLYSGDRKPADPSHPHGNHSSPIHVHLETVGGLTSVTAAWDLVDTESPMVDNMWAIGSVTGGVQIQSFTSVGHRQTGSREMMSLQHGIHVYVTVTSRNAAGLVTVLYSDPFIVDTTPPEICCLKDDTGSSSLFLFSEHLHLNWEVKDPETNIKKCEYRTVTEEQQESWMETDSILSTVIAFDKDDLELHNHVLVKIRCFNHYDMVSYLETTEVPVVFSPPSSPGEITVITQSPTLYPTRDSHQSDTQNILIGWQGLDTVPGFSHRQIRLDDKTEEVLPWKNITDKGSRFISISDLNLSSYTVYQISLRTVNVAGLYSDPVSSYITVETSRPEVTDKSPRASWIDLGTLHVDWTSTFESDSSLVYEINIGTSPGGFNVLHWAETTQSELTLTGLNRRRVHYVTVTAINKAGLYKTIKFSTEDKD